MTKLSRRAAMALARAFPGRDRAGRIALAIGCSERTAKFLLAGQHWTVERLESVGEQLGWGVENWLPQPASSQEHEVAMSAVVHRISAMEERFAVQEERMSAMLALIYKKNGGVYRGGPSVDVGMAKGLAQTIWSVSFVLGETTTETFGRVAQGQALEPA